MNAVHETDIWRGGGHTQSLMGYYAQWTDSINFKSFETISFCWSLFLNIFFVVSLCYNELLCWSLKKVQKIITISLVTQSLMGYYAQWTDSRNFKSFETMSFCWSLFFEQIFCSLALLLRIITMKFREIDQNPSWPLLHRRLSWTAFKSEPFGWRESVVFRETEML